MNIINVSDLKKRSNEKRPNFERPNFGYRQIRTIKGLDEGENVIQFCEGCGPIYLFKIMGFGVSQAGWFVIVNEIGSDGYYKHKKYISLSDCNIRSKNGKWESECCLLRTKSNTSRGLCRTKQKRLIKINKK